jgi:hypothetical protein
MAQDIVKILSAVLLTTIRKPALTFFSFTGDTAPFSVSNSAPEMACSVVLETRSLITHRVLVRLVLIQSFLMAQDIIEIVSAVLFTTIGEPALTILSFAWNSTPFSVSYSAP